MAYVKEKLSGLDLILLSTPKHSSSINDWMHVTFISLVWEMCCV